MNGKILSASPPRCRRLPVKFSKGVEWLYRANVLGRGLLRISESSLGNLSKNQKPARVYLVVNLDTVGFWKFPHPPNRVQGHQVHSRWLSIFFNLFWKGSQIHSRCLYILWFFFYEGYQVHSRGLWGPMAWALEGAAAARNLGIYVVWVILYIYIYIYI